MLNKRLIHAFPRAFSHIRKNVVYQWLGLLASIVSTLALCHLMMQGFIHQQGINWMAILIILVALAFRMLFNRLSQMESLEASKTVKIDLRHRMYEKLCQMGSSYQNKWSTSEVSQLMSEGVEQLETYFGQYIPQLFYALAAPLTLFMVVCFFSWKAALVLLICVPLIPASIVAVQKFAKKLLSRYWDQYTGLSDGFLENLQGLTTLKLYGTDGLYHQKMNEQAENFRKITMRVLIMQLNSISVMDLVAYGGSAAGILVALSGYLNHSMSLYGMMAIILLSAEFFLPMRTLGSYFHISMNGSAAADKMFALLDEPDFDGDQDFISNHGPVVASHLSFSYEPSRLALDDVSFEIPSTGLTGIVGESGSGKSTLASILTRKQKQYQGDLSIGSQSVSSLKKSSMVSSIGLLSSSSQLFKGTVRDNLLSVGSFDEKTMIDALKKTQIWNLFEKQGGLDYAIEEEGRNLSGGQKQRLAFARLLLENPYTLILDEATSSVDAATEAVLVSLIHELARDHQVIFITHRLANVHDADQILVFKEGKLVETGTEKELLKEQKEYTRLYEAQKALEEYVKGGSDDEEE